MRFCIAFSEVLFARLQTKGHNEVKFFSKKRAAVTALAAVAAATALALSGCSGSGSSDSSTSGLSSGLGSLATNRDAYFFTYYNPASDAFWAQIQQGAEDAAALTKQNVTFQTADGDSSKMVDLVQAAIATKPAVIYMPFNEGEAWTSVACQAHDAGIEVLAFNVPAPAGAADCVSGFVGQDFYTVGTIVAQYALDNKIIKAGDTVEITAEEPDQTYAIQRGGGVADTLKKAGVNVLDNSQWLRTGGDDAGALNALTSYLVANPQVNAIVPVGGTPMRNMPAALKAAGRTDVKVVGFDTAPATIQGIQDGVIQAVADQQGYVQGFQSVTQGGLYIDFGLSPANINSGGNGLITKDNVNNLTAAALKGIRY